MRYLFINLFCVLLFAGCATEYPCQKPGGISCKSVSAIYVDKEGYKSESFKASKNDNSSGFVGYSAKIEAGDPVRTQNKTVRVWMAPWVDNKDVFHDQSFVYMAVKNAHWLIEDARNKLMNKYKAVMPKIKKPIESSSVPGSVKK